MAIAVAARLGIADLIASGTATTAAIARRTGTDRASLARLLRVLTAIGVIRATGADRFALTPVGRHLAGDDATSLKAYALFEGEMLTRSWAGLIDSVRTGKTEAEIANLGNRFNQLAGNPEQLTIFRQAMADLTQLAIPAILDACDFSSIERLIDVGGGLGTLLVAILARYRKMRGVVFDLPRNAAGATATLAAAGVSGRAEFVAGDFFKTVPPGDGMILKNVMHDWDDADCLRILKNCRKALPKGGRLFIVERLMPKTVKAVPEDRAVAFVDLHMLRGVGGAERTERQYRRLIRAAGFSRMAFHPAGIVHVIEATAGAKSRGRP